MNKLDQAILELVRKKPISQNDIIAYFKSNKEDVEASLKRLTDKGYLVFDELLFKVKKQENIITSGCEEYYITPRGLKVLESLNLKPNLGIRGSDYDTFLIPAGKKSSHWTLILRDRVSEHRLAEIQFKIIMSSQNDADNVLLSLRSYKNNKEYATLIIRDFCDRMNGENALVSYVVNKIDPEDDNYDFVKFYEEELRRFGFSDPSRDAYGNVTLIRRPYATTWTLSRIKT